MAHVSHRSYSNSINLPNEHHVVALFNLNLAVISKTSCLSFLSLPVPATIYPTYVPIKQRKAQIETKQSSVANPSTLLSPFSVKIIFFTHTESPSIPITHNPIGSKFIYLQNPPIPESITNMPLF